MQPDLIGPPKIKEDLSLFKADFSTMRKINNSSILEMMKYDAHLLDTPRICPTNLKDRFGELIARYISAEREGIEEELDYCLTQLSSLFLGSTSSEDVRDFRFMDLHLRVQRYLRNPIYRSHTAHLLGVCLFSNLLLEADIDLLTLARTEYFFQALRSFDINKPKRNQEESKPTYYPGDIGSEMDRGVYPSGELFAVKLRKYLERKEKEDFKNAVCFFFDPFIWINLYHDWGYIYELEHLYSEGIYKNNKPPEAIEEIIKELNREKDEIEKEANFDLNRYFPNNNGIENALDSILSPPFNKEGKKEKIKKILNSENENEEAKRALDYILSFPLCPDESKRKCLREIVREKLSIKNNDEEIERALDCIPPSFDKLEEKQNGKLRKVVRTILTSKIKNHGIVSSLILYDKFLNIFKNVQVAERIPSDVIKYKEDALKDELGAICLHDLNLYENGIRLRLTDSPHYFLLKFADVISDWGRTYKGKVSLYDFSILDHILFGFNPTECTKPNGEEFKEDKRGILVNIIFDFSNNERLLADEIGLKDKSKNSYPRKGNYEFEEFVKKGEELQSLDYLLEIEGKEYQWFFFNLILIDRYGERFLIENSKNNVDLWWIIPPLFSEKFKKLKIKGFSRLVDYQSVEFEHEHDPEKKR
uniref:Uncharacterized protein n=1 Tax=Candidatus Methanophaga sp. ANME-1 ERB7 TaxID=2759913 RepID=A0A7G9Z736_9EURY|nr:hypothetical protein GIJIEOGM_00011 [Methanosarcinales archaeon ANME-1 ERB7]